MEDRKAIGVLMQFRTIYNTMKKINPDRCDTDYYRGGIAALRVIIGFQKADAILQKVDAGMDNPALKSMIEAFE